jgi:hypothetical protein
MCLVFKVRVSTKDIDAIFSPTQAIRDAAKKVARRHQLPPDWINDAAKGFFLADPQRHTVLGLSHLRVWAPPATYMLAMKCISARFDSHDLDDIRFLIQKLRLRTGDAIFGVIEKYYPRKSIPAKTQFVIEELMEKK